MVSNERKWIRDEMIVSGRAMLRLIRMVVGLESSSVGYLFLHQSILHYTKLYIMSAGCGSQFFHVLFTHGSKKGYMRSSTTSESRQTASRDLLTFIRDT